MTQAGKRPHFLEKTGLKSRDKKPVPIRTAVQRVPASAATHRTSRCLPAAYRTLLLNTINPLKPAPASVSALLKTKTNHPLFKLCPFNP